MSRHHLHVLAALLIGQAVAAPAPAGAQYSAHFDGTLVRLTDAAAQTTLAIVPDIGNTAVELSVKGHNVLRFPYASLSEFTGQLTGIPFLGPWANRLDEQAFYANGKRYPFDMELGNVRGQIPIHGFLTGTREWEIVEIQADSTAAWITSRLEFYRRPEWMKQWPFAHTIEITYRVAGGELEVLTRIENLSGDPMPIAVGFHPYFQLTDSPRDEWTLEVGARSHYLLTAQKLPSGEVSPIEGLLAGRRGLLKDYNLDDVFGDLVRDGQGRSTVSLIGRSQRLDVVMGPNYRSAVIYSPNPANTGLGSQNASLVPGQSPNPLSAQQAASRNFVCIEPMAGITNALNLAHAGKYDELQTVAPGAVWQESFWIKPSGF